MILADKIINERKKNGWSQEELAEQLSVSRQSVSKWEGAQAVPDLQKIIAMADIFGVTTDYLLKDEIEVKPTELTIREESTSSRNVVKVTLEDANEFIELTKNTSPKIAIGVSLCILSPVLLIVLAGLSEKAGSGVSEFVAGLVGTVTLLCLIAVAVYIFIVFGSKTNKFEYMEYEDIETAYGVSGMVSEKKKEFESKHTSCTALGVIMCILAPVPLIIAAFVTEEDWIITLMFGLLLITIAAAVDIFIRVGSIWECYEKLLEEGDFTIEKKKVKKFKEKIARIYWCLAVAVYLGWSFATSNWGFTWIVWPVAAVLYAVVAAIVEAVVKNK